MQKMSLYDVGRVVCRIFVKLAFSLKVVGAEQLPPDGSFILCCNHRTYMDPVFLGLNVRPPLNFMAKEELFHKPVLGPVIRRLGAFPVTRGAGDSSAIDTAIATVRDGRVLALFPEGTRSKDGTLKRFKSGAALVAQQTGADIYPACICFEKKLRFRSRVVLRFGAPIRNAELGVTGMNAGELKAASKLLQQRVQALLERGTAL